MAQSLTGFSVDRKAESVEISLSIQELRKVETFSAEARIWAK